MKQRYRSSKENPVNPDRKCTKCAKGTTITVHNLQCPECDALDKAHKEMIGEGSSPKEEAHAYKVLCEQIRILSEFQKRFLATLEGKNDSQVARTIGDISRSLAQVSKELLAYEKAEMDSIQHMTTEQWIEAVAEWFAKLSQSRREDVINKLHEIHWNTRGRLKEIVRQRAEAREIEAEAQARLGDKGVH